MWTWLISYYVGDIYNKIYNKIEDKVCINKSCHLLASYSYLEFGIDFLAVETSHVAGVEWSSEEMHVTTWYFYWGLEDFWIRFYLNDSVIHGLNFS